MPPVRRTQNPAGCCWQWTHSWMVRGSEILAAGSADHTVRVWDVAYLANVVPHLCASAGRSLTRAEWARYVPGPAYQTVCA